MNSVRYPIRSGFVGFNGTPVWLDEHVAWDGDDPFVKANRDMFEERDAMGLPIPAEPEPVVEPEPAADTPAATEPVDKPAATKPTRKPKNG